MYKKTQYGKAIVMLLLVVMVLMGYFIIYFHNLVCLFTFLILLISLVLFYKLTVIVNDKYIKVIFGIGLIKKGILLNDIKSCKVVKNRWWYGFGIRLLRQGWLFNISGLDAIEILMKNGTIYRIGTEEPTTLQKIIMNSIR